MQTSAVRNSGSHRPSKAGQCATLSVVVVDSGSPANAALAAQTVQKASRDLPAQVIVVSSVKNTSLATSVERLGGEFVVAPNGSSRAQMCDLGMTRVQGAIVVVRDVEAVGDAKWLDVYRRVLPRSVVPDEGESVVMDTMVTSRSIRADAVPELAERATAGIVQRAAAAL